MKTSPRNLGGIALALALCAGLAWSPAQAHGDQEHAKTAGPVRKEQKDWGIAGDARHARRTIEVAMGDDMRFVPGLIKVRQGETVRFVIRNRGQLMHEFVIGDEKANAEHAALMVKFPDMEHDEPYMAHVAPGKQGEMVWTFNRPGTFQFACLIAGHYQAGMVGTIEVVSR